MINRILTIPKYRLPFDNGITLTNDNIWLKYGNHMLYKSIGEDFKLFYKIIPYVVINNNDRYLVYNNDGRYCFNNNGLFYIKEGIIYEPIKSVVKNNLRKNNIKTITLKDYGFIKSIKDKPNDIAVVYIAKTNDNIQLENNDWFDLHDLINKCRNFDSFGVHFINHLVCKKYKE